MRNYVKEMDFIIEKKNSVLNLFVPLFSGAFFMTYSALILRAEYFNLLLILTAPTLAVFPVFIVFNLFLSDEERVRQNEIEKARQFLEETGQEASNENINILLNKYYKSEWQKIEDMLYETRKVPVAENIKFISGNVNQNLRQAIPAK